MRFRLALSLVTLALGASVVRGYVLAEPVITWADGEIKIHEQLGTGSVALIDGNTTWNEAFEGALETWNNHLGRVKFVPVRGSTAEIGDGNEINNVFFSDTVYGDAFNANTLAITTEWFYEDTNKRGESDIIFNKKISWNAYRGPLRNGAEDFYRVALHQIGYLLGLGNPDQNGQNVVALMNSQISDLDTLSSDDIAGVMALYPNTAPSGAGQVAQAEAKTDATGVATFTVGGSKYPLQFLDRDTASPIVGARALLFSGQDGSGLVMLADGGGRYASQLTEVQLPGARAAALATATSRPTQVSVPATVAKSVMSMPRFSIESLARDAGVAAAATPAGIALHDQALKLYAKAVQSEVIVERDMPFEELADLNQYLSAGGKEAGGEATLRLPFASGGRLAKTLHFVDPLRTAYDWRDRGWLIAKELLECEGYSRTQPFRVTVLRLPYNVPNVLKDYLEFKIYARPLDPPARPPCEGAPGSIAGKVVDAKTGQGLSYATVTGMGPTGFKMSAAGDGTFNRQYVLPGTYWLNVEASGHERMTLSVQVRSDETTTIPPDREGRIPLIPFGATNILARCSGSSDGCTIPESNGSVTLTATLRDGLGEAVTPQPAFWWNSDNPGVATIDRFSGRATAVKAGSTRVTGSSQGLASQPIVLTVGPVAPSGRLAVNPSSLGFSVTQGQGDPGSQSLTITSTGSAIRWQAASDRTWLTISPSSGTTSTAPTVSVSTSRVTRDNIPGTLTITSPDVPGQSIAVPVTVNLREQQPCVFSLSRTSVTVGVNGDTAAITVTTAEGCAWTATSNSSFISVTGGASGTRTGTVTVRVTANTGGSRSGAVTIAGQRVTVNQDGAVAPPPPPPPPPAGLNVTGTWNESLSGAASGTQRVSLTQSGNSISGRVIGDAVFGVTTSSSITGTVNGTSVSMTEVDRISASDGGVAVTCMLTMRYALTGSATVMTGNYTSTFSCTFNVPVPIPPIITSGSGTVRFTR
jgi:hypothetical protein